MRSLYFILLLGLGCRQPDGNNSVVKDSVQIVNARDRISEMRETVSNKPVSFYSEALSGDGLQGTFTVKIYETRKTFHYLMKIQYAEFYTEDTLKLPDFGMQPKPEIKPASEKTACVVGFYDNKNEFKEYKLVQVKNDHVKIKAMKHYAVATYRDRL